MKFQSSTLFVNTGRKPLPGMQKKKKNTKNTIALGICIAIITVLCIFVGLIVHVWVSYNEDVATKDTSSANVAETREVIPVEKKPDKKVSATTAKKKTSEEKTVKPKEKEEKPKTKYTVSGEETAESEAANKAFKNISARYSYGFMNLSDNSTYINNTEKINNSAALAPFLAEYASNGIYLGTFDYHHAVGDYEGVYLMNRAFSEGSVEAANLLIEHFGPDKLNKYFEAKGYENTHFGGTIGSEESYTTAEDLVKLMNKFHKNTSFFPYSDIYKKMKNNKVDDKITASLPEGVTAANITFTSGGETVDAAVVYTPNGNFVFVAMADGSEDELTKAHKAMANAASAICKTFE